MSIESIKDCREMLYNYCQMDFANEIFVSHQIFSCHNTTGCVSFLSNFPVRARQYKYCNRASGLLIF